jgi:hypothetical protein
MSKALLNLRVPERTRFQIFVVKEDLVILIREVPIQKSRDRSVGLDSAIADEDPSHRLTCEYGALLPRLLICEPGTATSLQYPSGR